MSDTPAADQPRQMTPEEAADFAEQVFNKAREGDAAMLAALLSKGLPANLRNHKGDTLLMLASYHGHVDAVKVLLEHKADPEVRNDNGQSPIAGAAFKGNLEMVKTGYAWAFLRYTHDPAILSAENSARSARLGLWSESAPIPPWRFRRDGRGQ